MYTYTIRKLILYNIIKYNTVHNIKHIIGNKPLGRWSRVNDENSFKRSDRANTDHCGTCTYHIVDPKSSDND